MARLLSRRATAEGATQNRYSRRSAGGFILTVFKGDSEFDEAFIDSRCSGNTRYC